MNRRNAIVVLGGLAVAAASATAAPADDVLIATETGWRKISGTEADSYRAAKSWLEARLKDVETVRVGTTYADVVKVFKRDGGIATPTVHRFMMILCPYLKVDIELDGGLTAESKVTKVSKPYFEREYAD